MKRVLICYGLIAMSFALAGCDTFHLGFLDAAGPVARQERHLFYIVCLVMLFVIGPVLVLTPIIAWHYRLSNTKSAYRPQWGFSWPLEGFIWIPPCLIVVLLAVILWRDSQKLDPYRPLASAAAPFEVQAVALDWKWLFIYPDERVATVDQLVFPADRPVHMSLTSGTVMQSLLIPRLAGQIYAMAGMKTELNFAADHPGDFHGENVQFNGTGFQNQKFEARALSSADFDRWLVDARSRTAPLDVPAFQKLAERSVIPHPVTFGAVTPGLFTHILNEDHPGARAGQMRSDQIQNEMTHG